MMEKADMFVALAFDEWERIKSDFPGWSIRQKSVALHSHVILNTEVGRWSAEIKLHPNGGYTGLWHRYSNRLMCHFGTRPEESFVFEPHSEIAPLLKLMDRWIDARRSPATWRGQVSKETALLLGAAKSNRSLING